MRLDNVDWKAYYEKTRGRPPRSLLLSALALENRSSQGEHGLAIDLGFGDGTDTLYLLENGWSVLAIDGEPAAKERLLAKVPAAQVGKLTTRITSFESLDLPPARLIYASLSLPFCHPDHFAGLWHKIETSLRRNGRFAGNFFGVNDDWAVNDHMTFHTEQHLRTLLQAFEIEYFHETDEPGSSASGPKHWHVFTVIAKHR